MKSFGNWKVKGDKVFISDDAYFEEGASGLPSLVGFIPEGERQFIYEKYFNHGKMTFAQLADVVKVNGDQKKLYKKLKKIESDKFKNNEISADEYAKNLLAIKKMVYFGEK